MERALDALRQQQVSFQKPSNARPRTGDIGS